MSADPNHVAAETYAGTPWPPIIRGESEWYGPGSAWANHRDHPDRFPLPPGRAPRRFRGIPGSDRAGRRGVRQRFIDWWCSFASPPSWPPSERLADGRLKAQQRSDGTSGVRIPRSNTCPPRPSNYGRNFEFRKPPDMVYPNEPTMCLLDHKRGARCTVCDGIARRARETDDHGAR